MKIPALRVEINGELIAVAGAEDLSILTGSVGIGSAGPGLAIDVSHVILNVMGLMTRGSQPRQLSWGKGVQLKSGDRVTFEIIEVDQPSPPDQVLRSPSSAELAAAAEKKKGNPK